MDIDLAQKAIAAAISGNWPQAVEINKKILKQNSKDTDALNRLARAHAELGQIASARLLAKKALRIDPFNKIAEKCLDKWKDLKKSGQSQPSTVCGDTFIEEPGKTKIVSLLCLGAPKVVIKLDSGDQVKLNPHGHRLSVISGDGKYIGRLPDDLGMRLKKLIQSGNEYQVLVKSTDAKSIKVFIREIKNSPKTTNIMSFPPEKMDYVSFTPPELVHKKDDIVSAADEE